MKSTMMKCSCMIDGDTIHAVDPCCSIHGRCICPTIEGERIEVVDCPVKHREYRTLDGGFATGPGQGVVEVERIK